MNDIQPLGDKVLVLPTKDDERSPGGVLLPESARSRPQEGTVVAVGPGRVTDGGQRVPVGVQEGDTVIFGKYGGTEIKQDGATLILMDEAALLAVKRAGGVSSSLSQALDASSDAKAALHEATLGPLEELRGKQDG